MNLSNIIPALLFTILSAQSSSTLDSLTLKNGQTVSGTIMEQTDSTITLRMKSPTGGEALIPYPASRITSIKLARSPQEEAILKHPSKEHIDALHLLWEKRKPYQKYSGNDSTEIALALLNAYLDKKTQKHARIALKFIAQLEPIPAESHHHSQLNRLKRKATAYSGNFDQALEDAYTSDSLSAEDEDLIHELIILKKFKAARKSWRQVLAIETEYPKWHLMPEIQDARNTALHQALDAYTSPSVFHPQLTHLVAEGLYETAKINLHIGENSSAIQTLQTIIEHYPTSEFAKKSHSLIKSTQQP